MAKKGLDVNDIIQLANLMNNKKEEKSDVSDLLDLLNGSKKEEDTSFDLKDLTDLFINITSKNIFEHFTINSKVFIFIFQNFFF